MTFNIDIETFCELDLKKVGMHKYAEHESFEVLLAAVSCDGQKTVVFDLTKEFDLEAFNHGTLKPIAAGEAGCVAWNAPFEWYCLSIHARKHGLLKETELLPLGKWRDTQLLSLYCGFPAALDDAGKALNIASDKQKKTSGKALIRTFSMPRKPTKRDPRTRVLPHHAPEKWELYKQYNIGDVEAEMEIGRMFHPIKVPDFVEEQWRIDTLANARGVHIDVDLAKGCANTVETNMEILLEEAAHLTGCSNPNSRDQIMAWLVKEMGEGEVTDMTKETVSRLLGVTDDETVTRVLEIRQQTSKAAHNKFNAMVDRTSDDSMLRGALFFYGANRTGRWAGSGVQPQNMTKTDLPALDVARAMARVEDLSGLILFYGDPTKAIGKLSRTAICAEEGNVFIDADFSAIEARVIAWLAGEEWVLEVFRTHGKIYEATAAQMFDVPIEKVTKGSDLRAKGKVASLALGFGGSKGALAKMDKGGSIDASEYMTLVEKWRMANPAIKKLWYDLDRAAVQTVITGQEHRVGKIKFSIAVTERGAPLLRVGLPSGRDLHYAYPVIVPGKFGNPSVQYQGRVENIPWAKVNTYGGKLSENVTQAVARDLLAESITRLTEAGFCIRFSVHDEVVAETRDDGTAESELARMIEIMSQTPDWAEGLPLRAEGWIGKYYVKD